MSPFQNPFSDEGLRKGPVKVLRPNPNTEEDLDIHAQMDDTDIARVTSYPKQAKRRAVDCKCMLTPSPGAVAPLLPLGNGKWIPSFGLGTWLGPGITSVKPDDYSVLWAVMGAIDCGYRHFDTAAIYGTEEQVGNAINYKIQQKVVRRDEVFITTKLWNDCHARDAVVPALKKSLENLGMDYVDLYLIHWPTGWQADEVMDTTDYIETWKGMQEARVRGMAKSIGVSNFNQYQLERLIGFSKEKPSVLQVELNLNLQQPDLLAYCCAQSIAVVAYTPFGSIFHSKAAQDAPPPRIDDPNLLRIAQKYNKSTPQIVLRYLVELGVIPIPKTVTEYRLRENIGVFDFQLNAEEKKLLQSYDCGYRTIVPDFLEDHPFNPFEKKQEEDEEDNKNKKQEENEKNSEKKKQTENKVRKNTK